MTDPTVVLISVGADSAALVDEIEKKGLRVVSCPFTDAEETIEREKPLLVILHGSRGAVELSTMLEDAADPPQVAVVAARSDLGTLMGLNRDIVVSLLATELTEKTVAARLEAVVRQRAKTLGLTLNLAARRMSMGPRPSLPRPPPARPDSKPQNLVLDTPTPDVLAAAKAPAQGGQPNPPLAARASRLQGGTAIGLPAPGRPDPAPPLPQRPAPPQRPVEPFALESLTPQLSQSLLMSDIPGAEQAKPPGPPPRLAPPKPATLVDLSEMESDPPPAMESLSPSMMESLSPQDPEAVPARIALPAPAVPRFEPSDLLSESGLSDSLGPELRAALPLRSAEPELPSAPFLPRPEPSDGGTSAGDDVLEAHRHRPPGGESDTFPPAADDDRDDDDLALPLLKQSRPPLQDAIADDFGATMLAEVTMPAIPGSLAAEALAAARLRSEPNHPIPEPPADADEAEDEEDRATVVGEPPDGRRNTPPEARRNTPPEARRSTAPAALAERARLLEAQKEQQPGRGWAGAIILLAAVGGGAAYVKWGMPRPAAPSISGEPVPPVAPANALPPPPPVTETAEPAPAGPTEPAEPTEPPAPAPADEAAAGDAAAPVASAAPAPVEPSAAAAPAEPSEPEPAPAPSDDAPATAATDAVTTEPAVLLDNPFATPDANLPGCEQLAPGAGPTTADPVGEASGHWALARKSIVKGDIENASRSMCLAVAINPQSPAVEGLARLYALSHSSAQALIWTERAIALAPTNRELLNLRGDAKSQLGQQDAAVTDWLAAMGISPDETKRRTNQSAEYANVARTEKGHGDLAKAEQFFRRSLGFEETNLVALTGMAETLLARQLYDQAGTFAVKALMVFEPVPEAYLVLGDVAVAKNDPARARASYERALAIRPDFWPAKKRLRALPK